MVIGIVRIVSPLMPIKCAWATIAARIVASPKITFFIIVSVELFEPCRGIEPLRCSEHG